MTMMHEVTPSQQPADAITLFFAEVERIRSTDPWLSPLGGGILAGITLDIAHDSRAFARALGIEHALVLREMQVLVDLGRLTASERNARTQRCRYAPVPLKTVMPRSVPSADKRAALAAEMLIASSGGAGAGEPRRGCGGSKGGCHTAVP